MAGASKYCANSSALSVALISMTCMSSRSFSNRFKMPSKKSPADQGKTRWKPRIARYMEDNQNLTYQMAFMNLIHHNNIISWQ
jgi:hypothetical protein